MAFLITEIALEEQEVYFDNNNCMDYDNLKSNHLYSFDLTEWKEFVK